jgi:molybdate transport system substrate-binding protein
MCLNMPRFRFLCLILILLAVGGSLTAGPTPQQKHDLTVSAAISMKDALDQIASVYSAARPDTSLHFNLGASGTLQHQIEQGAPVDVFISASPDQMDALQAKDLLLAGTRKDVVKNEVVLIVPAGSAGVSSFQDLLQPSVKVVAIGEPATVPAGKYAAEVLTHLGLFDRIRAKVVLAKDVRQVLTYVDSGNADAGIVYRTDAMISQKVKIAAVAPANSHSPVIYPVAVLKASHDPAAAKEFVAFLVGPQGQAVFEKYGFAAAVP